MLPFFPSLRPAIANSLWFDADESCDDDAEVQAMETEHQNWVNKISQIGVDLHPIGKLAEHMENIDTDDEDANESDDSDNSDDDDDDEMDEINTTNRITIDQAYDDDTQANETI
uniref:Anaphase-promoting complex subunit 15 n=1 Tax=Corethrella appendiculata TaxID=1370023 RepID=U5ETV7_9DIPT